MDRLERLISELNTLPKGYISEKTIGGKRYSYLQVRSGDTVVSKYMRAEEVEKISEELSLRKESESKLAEISERLSRIEVAAELLDKALLRKLSLLKLSWGMDSLSAAEKEKCISFSDAMTAIEGVPVSDTVKKELEDWKNGSTTFLAVFEQTLRKYGFEAGV